MSEFNIYRRELGDSSPPSLIASGLTSQIYSDTTVEKWKTYLYSVGAVIGSVEKISNETLVRAYNFKSSITSLFSSSEKGFAYDFSDLSTMFQDTAGTTPVTAVDQLVARVNDLSGNNNHLIQSSSGSRPILKKDSKGYYLLFDGTNDFLQTSGTVNLSGLSLFTAFASLSKERNVAEIIFETSKNYNNTVGATILSFDTNKIAVATRGTGSYSPYVYPDGYTYVDAATTTGGVFTTQANLAAVSNKITTFRKDGVSQVMTGRLDNTSDTLTNQTLYVGTRVGAAAYLQTKFRALVFVGKTATTTDIERLENLLI